MCEFIVTPLLTMLGAGGGATAAGATAGAATAGSLAQTIGTIVGIGGSIIGGIQGAQAAKANAAEIEAQKTAEAQMTAVEDRRTRAQYRSVMRRQVAELAARGIALDSPTAILLGQTAAQEMSFASQGVRQTGSAKQAEMTATQRALRARATQSVLTGTMSAADTLLTAAPQLWPELAG